MEIQMWRKGPCMFSLSIIQSGW
uniref:Uncharacterized protein n=1 Tax=Arundo donax TaxID=35708 RepID=A0A0A9HA52_ARUDO